MAVIPPPTSGEPITEQWGDEAHANIVVRQIQAGTLSAAMGGSAEKSTTVTFAVPFKAGTVPIVMVAVVDPTGTAARPVVAKANAVSNTAFSAILQSVTGVANSGTYTLHWIAYGERATVPVAPTAGQPIAEAWGDVIHDNIVVMDFQAGTVSVSHSAVAEKDNAVVFPHPFKAGTFPVLALGVPEVGVRQLTGKLHPQDHNGFNLLSQMTDGTARTGGPWVFHWYAYGERA